MDLNLHATRDREKTPLVALWQQDTTDPMNPRTLLMAHEEKHVRPVVSDMDPFLLGSKGIALTQPMESAQIELLCWTVERIREILAEPKQQGWNKRWLDVLRHGDVLSNRGIKVPKYGFEVEVETYDFLVVRTPARRAPSGGSVGAALSALVHRGEKLEGLEGASERLAGESASFLENARALREQTERKSSWLPF